MSRQIHSWLVAKFAVSLLTMIVVILLLAACNSAESGGETAVDREDVLSEVFLNPYKDECLVNGELQLCYVASVGDTGDFTPYSGEIENFDYEWGYGYALSGSGDVEVFRVEDVTTKTAEPGGVHFPLTITGGNGRIVETAEGVYEFYGEKSFTCAPNASCNTLNRILDREEAIVFKFETPDNPTDPLILLSWQSDTVPAQAGEEPGLVGKNWVMQSFTVSKDNVQPVLAGSLITADFTLDSSFANGTISGNAGCNDYTASITISGNSIAIDDLERGEVQCNDPAGIMEQEQLFTSALTVTDSFLVDGDRLEINYNSGDSVLNLVTSE